MTGDVFAYFRWSEFVIFLDYQKLRPQTGVCEFLNYVAVLQKALFICALKLALKTKFNLKLTSNSK